jgi:hypothetical protein
MIIDKEVKETRSVVIGDWDGINPKESMLLIDAF